MRLLLLLWLLRLLGLLILLRRLLGHLDYHHHRALLPRTCGMSRTLPP